MPSLRTFPIWLLTWLWALCWVFPTIVLARLVLGHRVGIRWGVWQVDLWSNVVRWLASKEDERAFRIECFRGLGE